MNKRIQYSYNRLTFLSIFNGYSDIVNDILKYKNEFEYKDIKNYYIERDFNNWLNNDVFLRNFLEITQTKYIELDTTENSEEYIDEYITNTYHREISLDNYYNYYDIYSASLGLTNFMRTKSLTDCYNSKWWKTTEKNNLTWRHIHKYITFDLTIKIYHRKYRYGWDYNEFFNELFEFPILFRSPTIREKNEILKQFFYIIERHYEYIIIQDLSRGYLLVDSKLSII